MKSRTKTRMKRLINALIFLCSMKTKSQEEGRHAQLWRNPKYKANNILNSMLFTLQPMNEPSFLSNSCKIWATLFFFSLHSLQLCETHKHTHINYPRSRNFRSLAQQLRSVINHFSGGTEADFWKKSQPFFKPLGAGPLFLYHSPTAYDWLAH